jgi:hypothetical protein
MREYTCISLHNQNDSDHTYGLSDEHTSPQSWYRCQAYKTKRVVVPLSQHDWLLKHDRLGE